MILLRSISLDPKLRKLKSFPFNLSLFKNLEQLEFRSPVTFLVGENGTGKSTLLEALAVALELDAIGGADLDIDETLVHARKLAKYIKMVWQKKTRRGFFFRAEDFFNFARRINQMSKELEDMAAEYDESLSGYGQLLAKGSVLGQRAALAQQYGADADARSHGESFLSVLQSRFVSGGLYLLDEPEAPLSPQRQLALLFMLKEMTERDSQFIIATHSPILMAFPNASILDFNNSPVEEVAYDDLEHVTLTRDILNNPKAFLRHLYQE
jgi:predicted ATPase